MKYGIDQNEIGMVDYWRMISPEEVSQEILQSLITNDFTRLRTLMISEVEMKELGLRRRGAHIRELESKAAAKFQATKAKLGNLSDKTAMAAPGNGAPPV